MDSNYGNGGRKRQGGIVEERCRDREGREGVDEDLTMEERRRGGEDGKWWKWQEKREQGEGGWKFITGRCGWKAEDGPGEERVEVGKRKKRSEDVRG